MATIFQMHIIPLLKFVPKSLLSHQLALVRQMVGYAITWTHFTDTFMHINMV